MTRTYSYILSSLLLVLLATPIWGQKQPAEKNATDSVVFRGISLNLDAGNALYTLATTSGAEHAYEALVNINLLNKYFPAIEVGFASNTLAVASGATYQGSGMFGRIGCDFNIMNPKKANHFFVGVRLAGGYQNYSLSNIPTPDDYWGSNYPSTTYSDLKRWDAWGEIAAGVQVQIYKKVHVGWKIRWKTLLTRTEEQKVHPYYIPGYGLESETPFGFNYYIGYTF